VPQPLSWRTLYSNLKRSCTSLNAATIDFVLTTELKYAVLIDLANLEYIVRAPGSETIFGLIILTEHLLSAHESSIELRYYYVPVLLSLNLPLLFTLRVD
jgi:hypothetical protein